VSWIAGRYLILGVLLVVMLAVQAWSVVALVVVALLINVALDAWFRSRRDTGH
jgi:hypothetical protein